MMTPIDIQNHQLKPRMGGYNKQETDDFLETVRENYTQLYKENEDLKKKIQTLSEGLQYYKQMESTLQQTLSMAEKTAKETLERSKTAAEKVGKETRAKADEMMRQAKDRADALVNDAKSQADNLTSEAEAKAEALTKESEENASKVTREAEQKAERVTRDAELRAERLTRDAREEADALSQESRQAARRITHDAEDKASAMIAEAEQKAENVRVNANERAERIMSETKASADKLIEATKEDARLQLLESNEKMEEVSDVLSNLMSSYESYKQQFTALLNKQLGQLNESQYQVNVAGLESLLDQQQEIHEKTKANIQQKLSEMNDRVKELDKPVDDSAPASSAFRTEASKKSSFTSDFSSQPDDIMTGGLGAGSDIQENEPAREATSAVSSLNIDTPDAFEVSAGQGIEVAAEDAEMSYKPPTDEEETVQESDSMSEIDAMAAEALKSVDQAMDTSYLGESSMLGTSYDDFVPEKPKAEEAAPSGESSAPSFTSQEKPVPPTTTDELPTVQETYDAETYVTNETYFGSADNMTYSIPDPSSSETGIKAESANVDDAVEKAMQSMPNIPMPDFSKLDAIAKDAEAAVTPDIPMPDFSALNAIAAEAEAALRGESSETPGSSGNSEHTVQKDYDAETYVTNETYFGSADNIPYSGASDPGNAMDSFAAGFSGIDPTANGTIPSAPGGLYSAPEDDGFAIPLDDAGSDDASFTFIDADK